MFNVVANDETQVVLKVTVKDNLQIALNPYIQSDYDYITVTKGPNHTLTVIKKDGTTFSFVWGVGGFTLISDNLERLRKEVVKFIESQNISLR
jgi:hypothetical protein